jgi:hypothetical protein
MGFSLTRAQKLTLGAILLVAAVLFGQMMWVGPINWDDDSNIFKNPHYALNQWKPFWTDSYFGLYVPVTSMVWQAMYLVGAGKALPFRVLNLLLHLANIVLVYQLLKSLALRWNFRSGWALVAATALFALHPMQIHAVAWISGGRDLLAGFFGLLCVYLFFRFDSWKILIPTTVLFTLAVLSKPNVVVLPALLPFLCWLIDRRKLRLSLIAALLWVGVAAVAVHMTLYAQRDFLLSLKWWERLLVMGDTYSFYLQKLVFPFPLSANYDRQPEVILTTWHPVVRTALVLVLGVLFYRWARRREPRFAIALAWLALLLPVSGIVAFGYQRISTPADHYHYLPMVALSAAVLLWMNICPIWPRIAAATTAALVVVLTACSFYRIEVWKSDAAFFDDMIAYAPTSYSTGLGMSVVRCERERNFPDGIQWAHLALKARPLDMLALANLAFCHFNSRDHKTTKTLEGYLDQLDLQLMEEKQPSAFSSFLASVGSAMVEDGDLYRGYQLLCHSYRIKPSELNHFKNIRVATEILQKAGINPVCEGKLNYPRKN